MANYVHFTAVFKKYSFSVLTPCLFLSIREKICSRKFVVLEEGL